MIEPVKSGRALAQEIRDADPGAPGVLVWWLGQSGYVIKSREGVLVIDPYLSEHLTRKYAGTEKPHVRMTRSPLRGAELSCADLVVSTHKHSDHMDPGTVPDLLRASPKAPYVFPRAHREHVLEWGIAEDRLAPADVDAPLRFGGVELLPRPAAHNGFDLVEAVGYPHMGFVIRMGGLVLYHSGDTVPYRGLARTLEGVDVAFLPINGRDARRNALGTPGNLGIDDALCLATVAGVGVLVPHHYDLFTFNTADIEEFHRRRDEAYPEQEIAILRCGERRRFTVTKAGSINHG